MEGLGKGGLEGWRGETEKIDGVTKWRVGGDKMGGLGGRTELELGGPYFQSNPRNLHQNKATDPRNHVAEGFIT